MNNSLEKEKKDKPKSILDSIAAFCKNNQTVGIPIIESYHSFQSISKSPKITFKQFEEGLTTLNKFVIKDLQLKCLNYIKKNGIHSYDQFINNIEFVTQSFWNIVALNVHKVVPKNDSVKSENNTLKDTPCKEVLKTKEEQRKPEKALHERTLKINDEQRDSDFKSLLPVNWNTMDKSERIDFAKKIQHKNFYDYVLKSDPQINHYIKGVKKERESKISIYVNLFSFPSDTTSEESKALLKSFVESLNMLGRARLQYVELNDPKMVEIREVRK